MAAQSKISYSGAGDDEAAARNYLSRKKSKRPISHSPDFQSHHSTTGAAVRNCKLSSSQIDRITQPYSYSYIAWVFGKDIRPWQLAARLNRHLPLTNNVEVSELNLGSFVLKFSKKDYLTLLRAEHPWSIPNLCIHAVRWIPNFKPSEAMIHVVDAWIRLHELPVEYYDDDILRQIAESIGLALVMIDPVTKDRRKCKYARICIRLNLGDPLPSAIRIGGIRQEIEYEGFDLLCPCCRRVVDNCLCNSSGSSRFDPHYRRARTFQEIGSSSNSKQPLISSEPSVAWGSRYQILGEESQALLLDLNDWPSLSVGGSKIEATRTSTSSLQSQLLELVAETIENQKEISGVSVQTLPNLPKESARLEEVSLSYHPISISSNPEAASTTIEVPVELEQKNLVPSIALHDHPLSISSYPEAASTTMIAPELEQNNLTPSIALNDHPMSISSCPEAASATTTTPELEQKKLIPSLALNDHPMSISSYPEAASTTTTTPELEQKNLIPSIAFHDRPMSISSYPEAASTTIEVPVELEQNNLIPSIDLNDHPMPISSYPEAASTAITAPELEQNGLIPSVSLNDHPMSISSSPEATLTTITAPAEMEQNNLNLSMALAPCVVKEQFRATETSRSTTLAVHNNQLQPSSPTASISSPQPSPTSGTALTFYSNVIERSIIEKEITNTPFEGNGISRCPILYTMDPSITSFAVGLSESPNSVPKQNQLVINIVSSSRSGNEHGIGSEAVSALHSKKMLGWKFCGRDNANLIEGLKFVVQKYETSIVVVFASWISDDDVEELVEELAFYGSYCKMFDDYNRGVWLLMFKQDVQTEVFEAPQQDSASAYADTETSWQTWGPASFCDSTYSMANTLAY